MLQRRLTSSGPLASPPDMLLEALRRRARLLRTSLSATMEPLSEENRREPPPQLPLLRDRRCEIRSIRWLLRRVELLRRRVSLS